MDYALLKQLCEAPGIPGREDEIRRVTATALKAVVDDIRVDPLGNVIGLKKGNGGPRVMLAAHMDEIGFFVKHIDDNGFIRLQSIGGWDVRNLMSQRVIIYTEGGERLRGALQLAAKPIHLLEPGDIKPPKMDEVFVDLGLPAAVVKSKVHIGDMVNMDRTFEETDTVVVSKSLDDRVAIFVMIEALRAMGSSDAEIVAVATTQEEVGLRGARTAAFGVEPDLGIGLDVTLAVDIPGAPAENAVTRLGKGAAIKVSVLSRFITVPPTAELDEIYQAAGVHRPPANPSSTIHSILLTLGDMIQYLVLPSYGTLTIWLATSAALLAILGTVLCWWLARGAASSCWHGAASWGRSGPDWSAAPG